jgi:archaemetzincin
VNLISLYHSCSRFCLLLLLSYLLNGCGHQRGELVIIQPLGDVNSEWTESIRSALSASYHLPCSIAAQRDLPAMAFTQIKTPRYRADSLLKHLQRIYPQKGQCTYMGVTTADISTTKYNKEGRIKQPQARYQDWGIFGLGQRPGRASVLSSHRMQTSDKSTFINRLKKVAVHELGHNMGLRHCDSEACVMQDAAESIKTIDRVSMTLCSKCHQDVAR